jgi:hypothetical protein
MGKSSCVPFVLMVIVIGLLISAARQNLKHLLFVVAFAVILQVIGYLLDKRAAKRADMNLPKSDQ